MILKKITDCISGFWHIATARYDFFEYVIEDIQLEKRKNSLRSQIYYRAIGSRGIHYDSATELNKTGTFAKFPILESQAIVSLATIESMMDMDKETLTQKYKEYAEQCAKMFQSQKKKS